MLESARMLGIAPQQAISAAAAVEALRNESSQNLQRLAAARTAASELDLADVELPEREGDEGGAEVAGHVHGAGDLARVFAADIDAEGPRGTEDHVHAEDGEREPEKGGADGGLLYAHHHPDGGEEKPDDGGEFAGKGVATGGVNAVDEPAGEDVAERAAEETAAKDVDVGEAGAGRARRGRRGRAQVQLHGRVQPRARPGDRVFE